MNLSYSPEIIRKPWSPYNPFQFAKCWKRKLETISEVFKYHLSLKVLIRNFNCISKPKKSNKNEKIVLMAGIMLKSCRQSVFLLLSFKILGKRYIVIFITNRFLFMISGLLLNVILKDHLQISLLILSEFKGIN